MLFPIAEDLYPIVLDLRYASTNNFTDQKIYEVPLCFLREECRKPFEKALDLASRQGLKFKIFDGFRPQRAQEKLWSICPDPTYVMPPEKGSTHTRGIAIDLTLIDSLNKELDMGTPFDDFTPQSWHGGDVSPEAAHNRYILIGIMMSAGWDFYDKEWWHYQLFNPKDYPLISDSWGIM
jgi:D-alanyl-D-alanine dipeptidase